MLMFYARGPSDEAGMNKPSDDWTWDDFVATAGALTDTAGDSKKYGYQPDGIRPRDIHWIRNTGKQKFDELVDPVPAMFDQPEFIDIVQQVAQDFQYKMGLSPTQADLSGGHQHH